MSLEQELQILTEARALIAKERNWTKGSFRKRMLLAPFGLGQYCSEGALNAVTDPESRASWQAKCSASYRLSETVFHMNRGYGIISYNDDDLTTHADILAAWDRAIADVKADIAKRDLATQAQTARVAAAKRYMDLAAEEDRRIMDEMLAPATHFGTFVHEDELVSA